MKLRIKSIKNRLKSELSKVVKKIQIKHLLDYPKYDIWLCDNIRLNSCAKEPETITWIETFGKDDVFADIGANCGAYSLVASKYCAKVYSFEPSTFNFPLLAKNIYINKISNIVPVNAAMSQRTEIESLYYSAAELGSSTNNLSKPYFDKYSHKQSVICYSLDDFAQTFKIPKIDHVKIDVDGIEFEILNGAKNVLSQKGFKSLLVEIDDWDQNKERFFDYLTGLKLKFIEKYDAGGHCHNYLFKKQN